jgi:hypothetical protein
MAEGERSIELTLEIPIALLEDVYPLTDFGFTLAHLILKNGTYRKFYRGKPHLMDNSMYELGEPMPFEDLADAVRMSLPHSVIAPDWMNEAQMTSEASLMMQQHIRELDFEDAACPTIAVVVQGKDLEERVSFFMWAQTNDFRPICFPFRLEQERQSLIASIASANGFMHTGWYHLLGLNEPYELGTIKSLPGRWSVDTGKPCRPGVHLRREDWADIGHKAKGRIDLTRGYTPEEAKQVVANVEYLRSIL